MPLLGGARAWSGCEDYWWRLILPPRAVAGLGTCGSSYVLISTCGEGSRKPPPALQPCHLHRPPQCLWLTEGWETWGTDLQLLHSAGKTKWSPFDDRFKYESRNASCLICELSSLCISSHYWRWLFITNKHGVAAGKVNLLCIGAFCRKKP